MSEDTVSLVLKREYAEALLDHLSISLSAKGEAGARVVLDILQSFKDALGVDERA